MVSDHLAPRHTPASPTSRVANRNCPSSAETLHQLAATRLKGLTRVPTTVPEVQEVLAQAQPATMPPWQEG